MTKAKTLASTTRKRLPETRESITHKFCVCGHEGYLTVGLYEDGSPGELFIRMAKVGSTTRGLIESLSIMTSLALQNGVPISQICEKMRGIRFEPLDDKSTSIVDCIFSWMQKTFIVVEMIEN